jgi:hypothetical protein
MRCPDDCGSVREGPDPSTGLGSGHPAVFFTYAPKKTSKPVANRTVRNADPDADAGSVVRCCAVPCLFTVPVRGRTRGSGLWSRVRVSFLKPRIALFKNSKMQKNMIRSTKGGTDPLDFYQNTMVKIF